MKVLKNVVIGLVVCSVSGSGMASNDEEVPSVPPTVNQEFLAANLQLMSEINEKIENIKNSIHENLEKLPPEIRKFFEVSADEKQPYQTRIEACCKIQERSKTASEELQLLVQSIRQLFIRLQTLEQEVNKLKLEKYEFNNSLE